ncbi:MAG TPA: pantoate--beta-alanine ligase [Quisquiliibacterium sp.]|nr:pantoate--beta-alanine ligase [Quisquiliibacterium sp.]
MRIEDTLEGLRAALSSAGSVGFVPTMGNLHEGHLSLVREARRLAGPAGPVVASIFVNRLQFGPNEDFDKYPRTFERDAALLRETGCDLLFAPDESVMYPEPQAFHVVPDPSLASMLEGAVRPGHFDGVCTVVMKLFAMVQPELAVFGRKDYQQLMLIRRMAQQFALPVRVVAHDTVRESDGLALSSRNGYLSATERAEAPNLNRVLRRVVDAVRSARAAGSITHEAIALAETAAADELAARGWKPDYITVRRQRDLHTPATAELAGAEPLVVLGAARLGTPRLLDNIEI